MGQLKKRLRTDLGDEIDASLAGSYNLASALGDVQRHGYIKKSKAEELVKLIDEMEPRVRDLRATLTEDDWEE